MARRYRLYSVSSRSTVQQTSSEQTAVHTRRSQSVGSDCRRNAAVVQLNSPTSPLSLAGSFTRHKIAAVLTKTTYVRAYVGAYLCLHSNDDVDDDEAGDSVVGHGNGASPAASGLRYQRERGAALSKMSEHGHNSQLTCM